MRLLLRCAFVMAFTLPFLACAALVASADEGSTGRQTPSSPPIRPPLGVLQHVDAPTASPVPTGAIGRELVVLVGGYQSCVCDATFDPLKARLSALPSTDVVRFGQDPRYPYDTYGSVTRSGVDLRDYIRSLAPSYSAVHVVAHSLGGTVVDRAFESGLSREDGVATYVAWSAPHSGSDAARGVLVADALNGGVNPALRETLLWLQWESESTAVRDLAFARPVAPPKGVVRLDLREATDVLVTPRDARDPGVESRTLLGARTVLGALEGHGGILGDEYALDLTVRTIATRAIPPERRPQILVREIEDKSNELGLVVFAALCVLTAVAVTHGHLVRSVFHVPPVDALRRFIPRAPGKTCR